MEHEEHNKPAPGVDSKTAEGKGEGGFAPHPDKRESDEAAGFEAKHRANVEPPEMKPVGKKKP